MNTFCGAAVADCTEAGQPINWQDSDARDHDENASSDGLPYKTLIFNTLDGYIRRGGSNPEDTDFSPCLPVSADCLRSYKAPTLDYRPVDSDHDRFIPLQRWEGTVVAVSDDEFVARLRDITTPGVDEEAILPVEDISTDDRELLEPGAMFYLNLGYHITMRGQRIRGMNLRMRRLPKWDANEVLDARARGREMLARIVQCD